MAAPRRSQPHHLCQWDPSPLRSERQVHTRPPSPAQPDLASTPEGAARSQLPNSLVCSKLKACGHDCAHVSMPFNCRDVIRHPVLSYPSFAASRSPEIWEFARPGVKSKFCWFLQCLGRAAQPLWSFPCLPSGDIPLTSQGGRWAVKEHTSPGSVR